jgi:hypothetical protein
MLAAELTLGSSASDLIRRHSVTQSLSSGDHKSFQLDHDYIQRYLGNLTVMQESKLVQLRECIADLQKGKVSILTLQFFAYIKRNNICIADPS